MKRVCAALAGVVLAAGTFAMPVAQANAISTEHSMIVMMQAEKYKNCKSLNKTYRGGVAKKGVKYNKVGKKKRAFRVKPRISSSLYKANRKLDRDKDGIACEK